jgi:hypothetical protein
MLALRPREVDRWLAEQPAAVVVELPVDQALRPLQDYYKTVHEQPTIFGPVGDSFHPPQRAVRAHVLEDFPSFASLNALRSWGTRYVLFTESEIQGWVQIKRRLDRVPGLHFERTLGGVSVYTIE